MEPISERMHGIMRHYDAWNNETMTMRGINDGTKS